MASTLDGHGWITLAYSTRSHVRNSAWRNLLWSAALLVFGKMSLLRPCFCAYKYSISLQLKYFVFMCDSMSTLVNRYQRSICTCCIIWYGDLLCSWCVSLNRAVGNCASAVPRKITQARKVLLPKIPHCWCARKLLLLLPRKVVSSVLCGRKACFSLSTSYTRKLSYT